MKRADAGEALTKAEDNHDDAKPFRSHDAFGAVLTYWRESLGIARQWHVLLTLKI